MARKSQPKTSGKNAATPPAHKSKPPPAPNEGRLGPAADPVEGKRD